MAVKTPPKPPAAVSGRSKTIAAAMAMLAFALFPGADALSKTIAGWVPVLVVVWARFFGSAVVMTLVLGTRGMPVWPERRAVLTEVLRAGIIIAAFGCFVAAFATISFAEAMTYYAIAPVVSVVWATLLLRERLTRYRLMALLLGFGGVVLALDPTQLSPAPGAFFALATGCLYGFYLFLTRVVAVRWNLNMALFLQFWSGTLLLLPWVWRDLGAAYAAQGTTLVAIALVSVICNLLLINAFRRAEASFLAPFFYIEIPSGLLIATLFLGEMLSWNILLGAAVIIVAGAIAARDQGGTTDQTTVGDSDKPHLT
ncbi:MAG: DMT family transporter [Albidovulum sp.]